MARGAAVPRAAETGGGPPPRYCWRGLYACEYLAEEGSGGCGSGGGDESAEGGGEDAEL